VDVIGVDVSEEMAVRAAERTGWKVAVADACRLPFRDAAVDGCYSVWVLHLVKIEAVLSEVWRVLAPGGRYVVIGSSYFEADDVVKRITDRMMFGLRGQAPDHPNVLAELATRQGFDFRIEKTPPRVTVASPKAMREQIETRALSQLWDLPTERWLQHVEPALAALREIGDEPLPSREAQLVAVLDKPTEPARRIQ
jgi:SAM-dependent methyltransferase